MKVDVSQITTFKGYCEILFTSTENGSVLRSARMPFEKRGDPIQEGVPEPFMPTEKQL